jgi:hypothetical protein
MKSEKIPRKPMGTSHVRFETSRCQNVVRRNSRLAQVLLCDRHSSLFSSTFTMMLLGIDYLVHYSVVLVVFEELL